MASMSVRLWPFQWGAYDEIKHYQPFVPWTTEATPEMRIQIRLAHRR